MVLDLFALHLDSSTFGLARQFDILDGGRGKERG